MKKGILGALLILTLLLLLQQSAYIHAQPLAVTLTPSNATLDSGQIETLNASWSGGVSPFAVNFFNVSGGTTLFETGGLGSWRSTNSYPSNIGEQSCVTYSNTIYCIGGEVIRYGTDNSVYYASILSSGEVGSWSISANTYPINIEDQSCVTYSNTIYCIGGTYGAFPSSAAIYYAPIFPSGDIGSWSTSANSYPIITDLQSCVTYSNTIYCIGGYIYLGGEYGGTSAIYSAPIFPSGEVGSWSTSANAYPVSIYSQSCLTSSNNIYCIAGSDGQNRIYYAPMLGSGEVGAWSTSTNTYPGITINSCVTSSNSIYCIPSGSLRGTLSDAVYNAKIFSSGAVGAWTSTATYPIKMGSLGLENQYCITNSNNIYCIGGDTGIYELTDAVYYVPIIPSYITTNSISYTFSSDSSTPNDFKYNATITDNEPSTANSITNTISVYLPMSIDSFTASNTPNMDADQYETFTTNVDNIYTGVKTYTYNFTIFNSITNTVIANQLYTDISSNSSTFTWHVTNSYIGNTIEANVIITDSASTPENVSSTTPPILINPALGVSILILSNSTLNSGQTETLTANIIGGIPGYSLKFFNVTGSKIAQQFGYKQWLNTTSYPTNSTYQSCITASNNIYCIGGLTNGGFSLSNAVYYAPISSSGELNSWLSTNAYPTYPTNVVGQSCLTTSNTIYCIGGLDMQFGLDNSVYYASILGSGEIGPWLSTNSYPINNVFSSCITNSNNIYCVGGIGINSVYYAPILGSGEIGPWLSTNSYPLAINAQSCVNNSNTIYCIGGDTGFLSDSINSVYYAPILGSGEIGPWLSTNTYPTNIAFQSCLTNSNNIYCVAGANGTSAINSVYYSKILGSGEIGTWQSTTPYPTNDEAQSCLASSNNVYCIGGFNGDSSYTNAIYYAPLTNLGVANTLSWSFEVNSPTSDNAFEYNVTITDATQSIANSITNTIIVNYAAQTTTTIQQSSGGSGGSSGGLPGTTSSVTSTSTITKTTIPVTSTIPALINSYYNITANVPITVNVSSTGTLVTLLSSKSSLVKLIVVNVTKSTATLQSYISIVILNVSTLPPTNITVTLSIKYPCTLPSGSIAPYIKTDSGWVEISNFSLNPNTCTVTFTIPTDPVVGLFYKQQASGSTILSTVIPSTSMVLTTIFQSQQPESEHNIELIIALVVIVAIISIVYYMSKKKGRVGSRKRT